MGNEELIKFLIQEILEEKQLLAGILNETASVYIDLEQYMEKTEDFNVRRLEPILQRSLSFQSDGLLRISVAFNYPTKLVLVINGKGVYLNQGQELKENCMSLAEIRAYDATRFQLEVLKEQIRREDEALQKHEIVVVDRTIYDNLFFALFYHDDISLLSRYMRLFEEREKELSYDLILYCEPLKPSYSVEHCILPRLIPPRIPVCHLPAVSPQRRVEVAVNTVREVVKEC